jgi:hypothetical protein
MRQVTESWLNQFEHVICFDDQLTEIFRQGARTLLAQRSSNKWDPRMGRRSEPETAQTPLRDVQMR